eukprot:SM000081S22661  [mRNA]  locus=s81:340739:341364:- [translate_table: standard]
MSSRTGIDAYILGLGASIGVMLWTGERFCGKREVCPAGILTTLAGGMSFIFMAAVYYLV